MKLLQIIRYNVRKYYNADNPLFYLYSGLNKIPFPQVLTVRLSGNNSFICCAGIFWINWCMLDIMCVQHATYGIWIEQGRRIKNLYLPPWTKIYLKSNPLYVPGHHQVQYYSPFKTFQCNLFALMNIEYYVLSDSFLLPCVLSVDLISVLLLTCRRLELFFLFSPFFFFFSSLNFIRRYPHCSTCELSLVIY